MTTSAFTLRCSSRTADAPRVLAPPPLIYGVALGVGVALHAAVADLARPAPPGETVAYLLMLTGAVLAGSFVRSFVRARTSIDFRPATRLVTTGVYRLTRNPGYVGMALVYAGVATILGAWLALVTLVPALVVIDRCVVRTEEAHLAERFGADYDAYRRRTRRWL